MRQEQSRNPARDRALSLQKRSCGRHGHDREIETGERVAGQVQLNRLYARRDTAGAPCQGNTHHHHGQVFMRESKDIGL